MGGNCPVGKLSRGQLTWGELTRGGGGGGIDYGVIVQGGKCPGGIDQEGIGGGQLSRGNCPGVELTYNPSPIAQPQFDIALAKAFNVGRLSSGGG